MFRVQFTHFYASSWSLKPSEEYNPKKNRNGLRYPGTGASVETEGRLRSAQDRMTGEPNEPLIQSAATLNTHTYTHTRGDMPLPVLAFTIKDLIDGTRGLYKMIISKAKIQMMTRG